MRSERVRVGVESRVGSGGNSMKSAAESKGTGPNQSVLVLIKVGNPKVIG